MEPLDIEVSNTLLAFSAAIMFLSVVILPPALAWWPRKKEVSARKLWMVGAAIGMGYAIFDFFILKLFLGRVFGQHYGIDSVVALGMGIAQLVVGLGLAKITNERVRWVILGAAALIWLFLLYNVIDEYLWWLLAPNY